jgi:hypothetical protein
LNISRERIVDINRENIRLSLLTVVFPICSKSPNSEWLNILDFLFAGMDLQRRNQTTCMDPYTVLVSLADPYTMLHVTGLEEDSGLRRCDAMSLRE